MSATQPRASAHEGAEKGDQQGAALWPPMLSIAGEQRGPGCRCPHGRRTGLASFTTLRRPLEFGHSGDPIGGQRGLAAQTLRRPRIGRFLENLVPDCQCLSVNMRRSRPNATSDPCAVLRDALLCMDKPGWESSVLRHVPTQARVLSRGGLGRAGPIRRNAPGAD